MRSRRAKLALLIIGVVTLAGTPAAVASESTVGTSNESTYETLPAVPPHAEGHLDVGATAGLEDSRSYVTLDLSSIPHNAEIESATLTLPFDAAASSAPDTATFQACVAGDSGEPPAEDCTTKSSAVFANDQFTVDLAPFLDVLRTTSLALVPVLEEAASWHVALYARDSEDPAAKPITATFELRDEEAVAPAPASPPAVALPPPRFAPDIEVASPVRPVVPPPAIREEPAPTPPPALGPAPFLSDTESSRYADSLVFTLPLVLLALTWYFGAALTRPIVVPESDEVSPRRGLPVPRPARLRARAAREQQASG